MAFYKTSTAYQFRMTVMKKMTLALLSLASLAVTTALPFAANAFEVNLGRHGSYHVSEPFSQKYYFVYYRWSNRDDWQLKGRYRDRDTAERVQYHLKKSGYLARIERYW
jgi:hypothetical protein